MRPASSEKKPTVLIVDDIPDNIMLLRSLLHESYRVLAATDGAQALQVIESGELPDLLLLDIVMPGMDGYEVCRRFKEDQRTADIPIIFLTARSEVEDERRGFELGAVDFVIRPISPHIVKARVQTHLQLKAARDFLRDKSAWLEKEVDRRVRENLTIQDVAMVALGSLAETRDNETGNHIRRTQGYVEVLTEALRDSSRFLEGFADGARELILKSAPLHDIGKVGIPDNILLKPGALTPEEFAVMKTHATLGYEALKRAERLVQSDRSFLRFAREIAWTHHEKWDGTGYPRGIAAEAIPVSGRLMAVADVYDAVISKRVYKSARTHDEAVAIIREGSGKHFDPEIVEAFLSRDDRFRQVARSFAKTELV